jgi:hypothetical protein
MQLAFEGAGLPLPFYLSKRDEAGDGFVTASDDDFFTLCGLFYEAREVGFGIVNGDDGYFSP